MKNIYLFYYPTTGIGGAQLLMARIAEYLINNNKIIKVLIDKKLKYCFIEKYLDDRNFKYEKIYISSQQKYLGKDNEILIIPQPIIFKLNSVFHSSSQHKVFQWDTLPNGAVSQIPFSKLYKINSSIIKMILKYIDKKRFKILKTYLTASNDKGSLIFMCGANFKYNSKLFDLDFHPKYLPLPVKTNQGIPNTILYNENSINIAWVGRIDRIKVRLIEFVIKDCFQFNASNNTKVNFYVIGDGSKKSELTKKYKYDWLKFAGIISNDKIGTFYQENNIKIGFNVGTSALEAGINGLYSVLLPGLENIDDFVNKKDRYLNLFDAEDYDVSIRNKNDKLIDFPTVISNTKNDKINSLRKQSFDYVHIHHCSKKIFKKLDEILSLTELNYQDIINLKLYRFDFLMKIKKIIIRII